MMLYALRNLRLWSKCMSLWSRIVKPWWCKALLSSDFVRKPFVSNRIIVAILIFF